MYIYVYIYIYIYICTYIYVIMKTMCPLDYRHSGFLPTHALGHMMYGYTLLVPINQRVLQKQDGRNGRNIYVVMKIM